MSRSTFREYRKIALKEWLVCKKSLAWPAKDVKPPMGRRGELAKLFDQFRRLRAEPGIPAPPSGGPENDQSIHGRWI
jgi:hypothetical protein